MSKKTRYTTAYFIKKFSAIPRSEWTTDVLRNDVGQACALGHCAGLGAWGLEGASLAELTKRHLGDEVSSINDGNSNDFPQKTPKGRILAALRKIEKLEKRK